jgi:hypothetical protein
VCKQETSKKKKKEAKDRYWAVKIQPQWVATPGKQTSGCFTTTCNLQKFISAARICTTDVEERREVKKGVTFYSDTSVLHSFDNSNTAAGTLGESLSTGNSNSASLTGNTYQKII